MTTLLGPLPFMGMLGTRWSLKSRVIPAYHKPFPEEFTGLFPGRGWKRRDYYASADLEDLAMYELGIDGYSGVVDFSQFERKIELSQALEARRAAFGATVVTLKEELDEERAARVRRAKAVVTVAAGTWVAVRLLLWWL